MTIWDCGLLVLPEDLSHSKRKSTGLTVWVSHTIRLHNIDNIDNVDNVNAAQIKKFTWGIVTQSLYGRLRTVDYVAKRELVKLFKFSFWILLIIWLFDI